MLGLALLMSCATGSGELVLKESVRVPGPFVRLIDLLDPARGSEAARRGVEGVWLGRAPAAGEIRRITADEIRQELDLRGLDPDAFALVGREVAVEAGPEAGGDALRRAVAVGIRRAVLGRGGAQPGEVEVRVGGLQPEPPAGAALAAVREDASGWIAAFDGGRESRVLARVLRVRETAVAARDIPAGTCLGRSDLEIRRVEAGAAEGPAIEDVVGATTAARIRRGAAVAAADLKPKPCIRRGDLVRFVCAAYEVDARATEDGAAGREIEVEIASTKARVRGRAAAAGRVEAR
jgi:flagella basal body P-ring formation protein FlgA